MSNILDQIAATDLEQPTKLWTCPGLCKDGEIYNSFDLPMLKSPPYRISYDPNTTGSCLHCGARTYEFYVGETK